jgi:hypothetical protein
MSQKNPPMERADVAIVGAGMAGLYCAWRLLRHAPKLKVVLFDLLDRTGGRLDTDLVHVKDLNGKPVEVKDEEGGMRFNPSMQELITLLYELGLCDQVVPFGSGDGNNRYYVRGRSFTVAESQANQNAIWSELYDLAPTEQSKSPGDIIAAVYAAISAQNNHIPPDYPTPEYWQDFRLNYTFNGIPLNQWGLWSLLRAAGLSEECIEMLTDTVGFAGPFLSGEVNAGEAYQILMDFPKDPTFFSLNKGYSTLPNTLRERIKEMGAAIHLNSQVTRISREAAALLLNIEKTGAHPESHAVSAAKVILALPEKALSDLYATSPVLNTEGTPQQLLANIQSTVGMRLCKVNFYYREAWWRNGLSGQPNVKDGGSFTNLPAGSVYVFDPIRGESDQGPAALTIYCDFTRTNFWEQLQAVGPKFSSPLQEEHNHAVPRIMYPASEAIVEEATRQFKELFKTLYIPRPVLTSFRLWGGSGRFGDAYHQWVRFADDRAVMAEIANPVDAVYICNEAYSDDQGWVNGSLRSAEIVLTKHFGLAPLVPDPKTWKPECQIMLPPPKAPAPPTVGGKKLGGMWGG